VTLTGPTNTGLLPKKLTSCSQLAGDSAKYAAPNELSRAGMQLSLINAGEAFNRSIRAL
jgi:hypothetical protein